MPEEKKIETLKRQHIVTLLFKNRKKVFEVDFIKDDGEERHMIASMEPDEKFVKEYIKNKSKTEKKSVKRVEKFDPDHITVFDLEKRNFRKINIKTAKRLRLDGVEYKIV
ncbi:hypothetical protein M0R19_07590 [Candidatus Pacearchaeota archaeon]|jgi:hypothetical protein|nr:hypothetical protein [bacterium]MCK9597023.1 hypothetical protein [Candidatus Pacearchaeota archaeon]